MELFPHYSSCSSAGGTHALNSSWTNRCVVSCRTACSCAPVRTGPNSKMPPRNDVSSDLLTHNLESSYPFHITSIFNLGHAVRTVFQRSGEYWMLYKSHIDSSWCFPLAQTTPQFHSRDRLPGKRTNRSPQTKSQISGFKRKTPKMDQAQSHIVPASRRTVKDGCDDKLSESRIVSRLYVVSSVNKARKAK